MSDSEKIEQPKQPPVQIHVSPELEYRYKDVFNVFVGMGDVIVEFGNHHRSMPGRVTISDRIVLSVPNAYKLVQNLHNTLKSAEEQLKKQLTPLKK
ncbi:MAG: DUF3467 domain-containing protein [SAR324 cluster bacterium]|nr:DUF3467 domain-containing protein [SAR324 cluster bacterium]